MNKFSWIILSGNKEKFLSDIRDLGVIDIIRSDKAVDEHSEELIAEMESLRKLVGELERGSDSTLAELLEKRKALQLILNEAEIWGDFDKESLETLARMKLGLKFYCCPERKYDSGWESLYPIKMIASSGEKLYFVTVGETDIPLKEMPRPSMSVSEAGAAIRDIDTMIEEYRSELERRKSEIPGLRQKIRELSSNLDLYLASLKGESAAEDCITVYEGFAPVNEKERLCEAFDKMDLYYNCEEATPEDNPPIKLKNNWFSRQFEVFTGMYGMPVYNEFDPTSFLSVFFLLFFALCMGDAGYGALLIVIGFILRKKESSGGLAGLWRLIVILGFGTLGVGILMGSAFGKDIGTAVIKGEIAGYSAQMVLSLAIGIVHISLAMIVKAVYAVKNSGFRNSLGTLGWTLLIVGGVIAAAVSLAGLVSEDVMKWIIIGIASVSALGIFLFNTWGRNPLVNIGSGLWDTYSMASGLMGDVLSYIRLYALGLSGGMLGATFNQIAEMVRGSDPTWQWVPFVLILVVGHALNLAMSCLGAFVHPLRLNFVEFFKNSGYEGRGRKFNPINK